MKVSGKLLIGFSIVISLAVIVGLIGITGMNILRANGLSMYENQVLSLENIGKADSLFKKMRLDAQQAVISCFYDDQKGVADIQEQFVKDAAEFEHWLGITNELAHTGELLEFYSKIIDLFKNSFLPDVINLVEESIRDIPDHNNKLFINVMSAYIDEIADRIDMLLAGLIAYNSALAKQTSGSNDRLTLLFITILVLMLVFAIIAAVIVATIIIKSVTAPINQSVNVLKELSKGDFTRYVQGNYQGEFALIKNSVNDTVDNIKSMILNIRKEANALSDIGIDLSDKMNGTAAAIREIVANIRNVRAQVINQSASVTETNATMAGITTNINNLNKHVEDQSASVTQSSSSIEQMLANIKSVADTLNKNSDNVITLKEASEIGRTGLSAVVSDIQEISRESEGLMEINSVMNNIASQTNLLSMNAAIEAAHAGEAGRGFAVVADEIRKLAENSGKQSKTISTVLKKMKSSIDKISQSTDNVLKKFEAIDSSVQTVSQQEENITRAMEEQSQGSKQVLQAIGYLNDTTGHVRNGSNEMLVGAKEVIRESENLEKVTQQITNGINEMAGGADEINSAVSHINELSSKNRNSIDLLMQEVSRFKVE
ncbi:MAG: methyl-accepting chemotaxis protein [Treponema sp.]|nr:methyl-accepting chemotaxis protein [Treponema sp.]